MKRQQAARQRTTLERYKHVLGSYLSPQDLADNTCHMSCPSLFVPPYHHGKLPVHVRNARWLHLTVTHSNLSDLAKTTACDLHQTFAFDSVHPHVQPLGHKSLPWSTSHTVTLQICCGHDLLCRPCSSSPRWSIASEAFTVTEPVCHHSCSASPSTATTTRQMLAPGLWSRQC